MTIGVTRGSWMGVFTAHEVNPGCDAHLLALLHHLKGLVKENLTSKGVVYDLDVAVCEGESASRSILLHCDATSEGQLDDDASSQSVRNVVVPKREVAL
jgi:hypothetical protein